MEAIQSSDETRRDREKRDSESPARVMQERQCSNEVVQ
jgi:hypothetical protein